MEKPSPLKVDIVSDVVCPWCLIGYKQLLKALEGMPGRFEVSVAWQPFELNPHMPPEGQDLREHLAQKYGSTPEGSRAARSRLTELGQSLGFTFDYYEGMRMYNTFSAHQLLHWAGTQGKQTELKMELFAAFFSRREDVSDVSVLAAAAGRAGLSPSEAAVVVEDKRFADTVRTEQAQWLERDVYAVPTFFFNEKYLVPGAQDAETFTRVLNKLSASEAA